jgi:hypothetical protein
MQYHVGQRQRQIEKVHTLRITDEENTLTLPKKIILENSIKHGDIVYFIKTTKKIELKVYKK